MGEPDQRRRSERARQAILNAADDLLVEKGFDSVTIEGIAARAGVGKQTIYRWWPSKTDILLEALLEDAKSEVAFPDTGNPSADIKAFLKSMVQFVGGTANGHIYKALLGRALLDPEAQLALRSGYQNHQRKMNLVGIRRALRQLDLPELNDAELNAVYDTFLGPILFRGTILNDEVEPAFIGFFVDVIIAGLRDQYS